MRELLMRLDNKIFRWRTFFRALCIVAAVYLCSCHSTTEDEQMEPVAPSGVSNMAIMGYGRANEEQLERYFLRNNPSINKSYLDRVTKAYIRESSYEGVNSDVAFVQMCHETNFLRFGNQVKPAQNNFAGIGATDDGARGATFKTVEEGVRAQIQHLKAYASKAKLNGRCVDPRFYDVKRGSAIYVSQLGKGKWATDPNYSKKLIYKLNELYRTNGIS